MGIRAQEKSNDKKEGSPWASEGSKSNGKGKSPSSSGAGQEIDEIVRKGQERLRVLMGGKSGNSGNSGGTGLGDGLGKVVLANRSGTCRGLAFPFIIYRKA